MIPVDGFLQEINVNVYLSAPPDDALLWVSFLYEHFRQGNDFVDAHLLCCHFIVKLRIFFF